ncbi:hypothetical protein BT63DRAFT_426616 [Microthyrium microscopicum]|uniref:EamA domain-containing protein n=1 Tax=Microthyrium microscopicum TaxID=703497 RepID=A0A6A6U745_9PEZI|nr:hypothetical protein BT63DRAFT_426616 [Microthyrium microscopicum]
MDSLKPIRLSYDDRIRSISPNNLSLTAKDIELQKSSHLTIPKIRRFASPALSDISVSTLESYSRPIFTELDSTEAQLCSTDNSHQHGIKSKLRSFWQRNWGLAYVFFAQFFGTLMGVTARLLEQGGPDRKGMHPFQILFNRMIISTIVTSIYIFYSNIPEKPLGHKSVRFVLAFRGVSGFVGVSGMFFGLQYLPLSDATVIGFLAPPLACLACSYILKEPFTRLEQIATMISLFGVVLISQPTAVFSSGSAATPPPASGIGEVTHGSGSQTSDLITPQQRLIGVGCVMLGVLGGGTQLVCLRYIGTRAHPLISVNYLNVCVGIISGIMLTIIPGLPFALPSTALDWFYITVLSASGIILQALLASGLGAEKSSRATNMSYSAMLFAVTFDLVIWGTVPGLLTIVGSSLIVGSAVYVALQKDSVQSGGKDSKDVDYIPLDSNRDEE